MTIFPSSPHGPDPAGGTDATDALGPTPADESFLAARARARARDIGVSAAPSGLRAAPSPTAPGRPLVRAEPGKRAIEELALLAAAVARTPMSEIALVTELGFAPEVCVGPPVVPAILDELRSAVLARGGQLVIDDLAADPRLREMLGGAGSGDVRFYAGVPLIGSDGGILGVLSVMDVAKRSLDPLQEELHVALGRMTGALLEPGGRTGAPGPALLAASARLKALLEHADALIYIKNAQGRFVMANRAMERLVGREPGRMLGALQTDVMPLELTERQLANDIQVREHGGVMTFEEQAPHPDGTVHDFVATKFPLPDAEGRMELVGGISVDVTEVRRLRVELATAERARRESEQRFALTFDRAPSAMALVALRGPEAGRFLRVNRALCEMTGFVEDDLVGKSLDALGHPEERSETRRALKRLAAGEQSAWEVDCRYRHADGRELWVHCSTFAVDDIDWSEAYAVSHIREITARKKAVARLADPSTTGALLRGVDAVMSRTGTTPAS